MTPAGERPRVGVIMGSDSDWPVMADAAAALAEFDIPAEVRVVSAHRTPEAMFSYARGAAERGLEVIIAGAGGAAHLPGMVAAATPLPVIGVPVPLGRLDGLDSLLSIVQMPAGVPVATVSIGGAGNAGLLAVRMLGAANPQLRARIVAFQDRLADVVAAKDAELQRLAGKLTATSTEIRRAPRWLDGPETRRSICSSCPRNTTKCDRRYGLWRKRRSLRMPPRWTRRRGSPKKR
ncbi:phosphoribosylaminoimidazole carboxylase [Mycobacterium tuberculosis]|nr:phosphoribosylaminoimidazole carboxylase [Mycobacterium tuberculosis]CKM40252.1 phosphoribosylaminoimidazole carboxylase [Mycobacterium tuberculosis]